MQVGWDSNDYQLDIGTAAGRAEYKRMIARDGELGITHAIFAPQNSKESSRYAPVESVDAWGWEESLWFSMGEKIRRGEWSPGNASDAVPAELQEMLDYAESHGVKLLAYVYPVLPFIHAGAEPRNGENGDGWLFDGVRDTKTGAYKPNFNNNNKPGQPVIPNCTEPGTAPYSRCQDTRASLSNVEWQDYLAQTLIDFVTKTGAGGFAYDYTAFRDWRPKTDYDAWRGWTRILAKLRAAHPDIVMDHRQSNHQWGAWSQAAGSYSEPIAGDENPESYGSKGVSGVTTLSTDHVLANNLRVVNSVYRGRQLLPNSRIPGFMSHQVCRSHALSYTHTLSRARARAHSLSLSLSHVRTIVFFSAFCSSGAPSTHWCISLSHVLCVLSHFPSFPFSDGALIRRWRRPGDKAVLERHGTLPARF
jgi:hypothetical protein